MNNYCIDTLIVMSALFTNDAGVPVDPTTVNARIKMVITATSGEVTDLTADVTRIDVGSYQVTYTPTVQGQYQYLFQGSGTVVVAGVGNFNVNSGF